MKKGSKHSDETKKKISEILRKMHKDGELSATFKDGHIVSKETRDKIAKSNTRKIGYWNNKTFSDEHKNKLSLALTGRKKTKKHRENISQGLKGKKKPIRSEEHRRNMAIAKYGIPNESKKHIELKEKVIKFLKGCGFNIEVEKWITVNNNRYRIDVYATSGLDTLLVECGGCPTEKLIKLKKRYANILYLPYSINMNGMINNG